jgi:multicomponent Na+:H+ antiporter subunit E
MGLLFINIMLAFLWSALTGQFTLENLTAGFVLGYIVLYLLRGAFGGAQYFSKGAQLLRFTFFFLVELLIANVRVARDVLRPGPLRMKPRVIAVPLTIQGDVAITLLANVISLTPGTLSLDISDDRKVLFVHAIHAPDADETRLQIKEGFERLVSSLFTDQDRASQPTPEQEK